MKNLFLPMLFLISLIACQHHYGKPGEFSVINLDEIKITEAPVGVMFKDSVWLPAEGYELVPSKDNSRVMLMKIGSNDGISEPLCHCTEGGGSCERIAPIIGCKKLEGCSKCNRLLNVYTRPIYIDRSTW